MLLISKQISDFFKLPKNVRFLSRESTFQTNPNVNLFTKSLINLNNANYTNLQTQFLS